MREVSENACSCVNWVGDEQVRICPSHHRYFRGKKELASVTRVIRECWPVKKNFEAADPAVLENARERGVEADWLFSEWIGGNLLKIPAGMRQDAIDRFYALRRWWQWDAEIAAAAHSQVILADSDIAGMSDVICVNLRNEIRVWELKNVSALDPSYELQVGAYAELYEAQYGVSPVGGALIHVTQPSGKPVSVKYVEINLPRAREDWRILRACWMMANRRAPRRPNEKD